MELLTCFDTSLDWQYLNSGKRSDVYKSGNQIAKIVKVKNPTVESTFNNAKKLRQQYKLLDQYLSPYVTSTNILIGTTEDDLCVASLQQYVPGISLREVFATNTLEDYNLTLLQDFLAKSLHMYQETGQLPDIVTKSIRVGFGTLRTENLLFTSTSTTPGLLLIDTNFSRYAEKKGLSRIHNRWMAWRIERELAQLN